MVKLVRGLFKLVVYALAFYGGYNLYISYFRNGNYSEIKRVVKSVNRYIMHSFEIKWRRNREFFNLPASNAQISDIREKICRVALSYLGTRYRYGGTSIRGIDCSGLVYAVYNKVMKVDMPRTAYGLYDISTRVKTPLPGDLVFFKIRSLVVNHVGIYLGDNKMVHASSRAGVCVVSLNKRYYRTHFYGFGRLLINK